MESENERPDDQLKLDCKQLMEHPATRRVLSKVRAEIRREAENSEPHEKELREHCYHLLNAIVRFENRLKSLADGGKLTSVRRERAQAHGGVTPAA